MTFTRKHRMTLSASHDPADRQSGRRGRTVRAPCHGPSSSRPAQIAASSLDCDFTRIKGIGPVTAQRLVGAGLRTIADLAALTPADLASRVTGLSKQRIIAGNWIRQARWLARRQVKTSHPTRLIALPARQRYTNFIIDVLMDADNHARRTRITHVQSGSTEMWADWDAARLMNFMLAQGPIVTTEEKQLPAPASPPSQPSGAIVLRNAEVYRPDSMRSTNILPAHHPFTLRLTLGLNASLVAAPHTLEVAMYVCRLGQHERLLISETSGELAAADPAELELPGITPMAGLYRLEVLVRVQSSLASTSPCVWLKGKLIEVY